jgi:hypothetical protein
VTLMLITALHQVAHSTVAVDDSLGDVDVAFDVTLSCCSVRPST